MQTFEFYENNSGGYYRLNHEDYLRLEAAGWKARSFNMRKSLDSRESGDDTYCGDDMSVAEAKAQGDSSPYMKKDFESIRAAVEEWEEITGKDFFDQGCNCCGAPYRISSDDDTMSGDSVRQEPVRPW